MQASMFWTVLAAPALMLAADTPTFNKDIQPILANRCQTCHRAGEIGPMPLMTYSDVRPWAKAIKQSVATRRMPPWFADPHYGKFANDRSMTAGEIAQVTAWVDAGAPEGAAEDKRPPREFVEGWNIPQPDLVVGMEKAFAVPAGAKVDYQYIIIPLNLTEDKWVKMVESRPSDPSVVHHVVVFIRDAKSKWLRDVPPQTPFAPSDNARAHVGGFGNEILHIYTPGNVPDVFAEGQAKLIPAGSDLVLQMHYTSTKKSTEDRTRVGMVWAKEPPKERIMTLAAGEEGFAIPPGADNYAVPGVFTMPNDGRLLSFFPHMHLRGKGFEMNVIRDGQKETLLKLPRYDFNWQLTYKLEQPVDLKRGMKVEAIGYFDNSPNNPYNPDPKATVKWGEQSWEEMMYGFFDVAVDARYPSRREWFQRKLPADTKADD
jgi:hypothetical protein